jgi:hypothetical protein
MIPMVKLEAACARPANPPPAVSAATLPAVPWRNVLRLIFMLICVPFTLCVFDLVAMLLAYSQRKAGLKRSKSHANNG